MMLPFTLDFSQTDPVKLARIIRLLEAKGCPFRIIGAMPLPGSTGCALDLLKKINASNIESIPDIPITSMDIVDCTMTLTDGVGVGYVSGKQTKECLSALRDYLQDAPFLYVLRVPRTEVRKIANGGITSCLAVAVFTNKNYGEVDLNAL
jgi:hypothetical protein